ncbi:MAG TPA: hypothetical protein PKD55_17750 [Bellilinea sp.]|nr:hypothetical protein [Bellilinea sp.]
MTKRNKRRRRRSAWWKGNTGWGIAAAVVGIVLIFAFVWYRNDDSSSLSEVSLDKSKGNPDASVTVVEYGDFQ